MIYAHAILARVDLAALIGGDVKLRRSGRAWWGACPLHNEKTSSLQVRPERRHWHCFGCGRQGDAITWVRELRGLSFREACEYLSPGSTTERAVRYADPMDDPVLRDIAFAQTARLLREHNEACAALEEYERRMQRWLASGGRRVTLADALRITAERRA